MKVNQLSKLLMLVFQTFTNSLIPFATKSHPKQPEGVNTTTEVKFSILPSSSTTNLKVQVKPELCFVHCECPRSECLKSRNQKSIIMLGRSIVIQCINKHLLEMKDRFRTDNSRMAANFIGALLGMQECTKFLSCMCADSSLLRI